MTYINMMETVQSLCERFHQWLDEIFTSYNDELRKKCKKVDPLTCCQERWKRELPQKKKDSYENDFVVVQVSDYEREYDLEKKYLNGYPNGAGKRHSLDHLI